MIRTFAIIILSLITNTFTQSQTSKYEVGKIEFIGNNKIGDDELLSIIRTRETPWAFWKWIYNRFDKEILGGQKPEYYDPLTFASDFYQLKMYYKDYGFIHSKIDTSIILRHNDEKVHLNFLIDEGPRSLIDTIFYKGHEYLPQNIIKEIFTNAVIKVGDPFIQSKIDEEHKRLIAVLVNNGYINMKMMAINAYHYTSTNNFSIYFIFEPNLRYTFGSIKVTQDTLSMQRIDTSIVYRHLDFKEGEFYSELKKIESERSLNRLGIFEATKIENISPNVASELAVIPMNVNVRTRPFQELTPEIGMNDENNAFNVMFGLGYNHRNFFGGARNYSTRIRLNLQSFSVKTIFRENILRDSSLISKIEFTTQIVQPYFINNKTNLSFTISAMLDKQPSYYIPSVSSRIGLQSQTATYTKLFFDWNLQLSDPKTVVTQKDTVIGEDFKQQFNSFFTITLQRDKRNDIFNPSEGTLQSISIEEGGLIPQLFSVNLPYAKYIKLILDGQWYRDANGRRDVIWAFRARAGGAYMLSGSPLDNLPLTQRFYSGGSGSVRGWKARELGIVKEKTQGGSALFEGNIEARWNFLKEAGSLWFIDLQKFSLVFFIDQGNIWSKPDKMKLDEIAMAFGLGLRYNTIAGPIRIDFGMKLYDPEAPISKRWVTQRKFFAETGAAGVIHLGVGHTF